MVNEVECFLNIARCDCCGRAILNKDTMHTITVESFTWPYSQSDDEEELGMNLCDQCYAPIKTAIDSIKMYDREKLLKMLHDDAQSLRERVERYEF